MVIAFTSHKPNWHTCSNNQVASARLWVNGQMWTDVDVESREILTFILVGGTLRVSFSEKKEEEKV